MFRDLIQFNKDVSNILISPSLYGKDKLPSLIETALIISFGGAMSE
jgi:ABC-type enterochelin transport system permease subunit